MNNSATKRIDPDPFTIIAAVAGVVGAATGAVALWRDVNRPLPSRVRAQLLKIVSELESATRYLGADLDRIERIFARSIQPNGPTIRMGNGAFLTLEDFTAYQEISDQVFERLRITNKLTLKLERLAMNIPESDPMFAASHVGDFTAHLQNLFTTQDLSHQQAWGSLRKSIQLIEDLCDELRRKLRSNR